VGRDGPGGVWWRAGWRRGAGGRDYRRRRGVMGEGNGVGVWERRGRWGEAVAGWA